MECVYTWGGGRGGGLSRLCVCMGNGIEQTVYIGR